MDEILNEYLQIARKYKTEGQSEDDIRMSLLEDGLDIEGIEKIVNNLSFNKTNVSKPLLGIKVILLGLIVVFAGALLVWIFIFISPQLFFLLIGLCLFGIIVLAP